MDTDDIRPVSDPEALGIPGYADDDSSAYDEAAAGRVSDGSSPAPLPPDREDGPLALDEYGTTAGEGRRGESLDRRLLREEPEVGQQPAGPDPAGAVGRLVQPDEGAHSDTDAQEVAVDMGLAGGGFSAEEAAMHVVPDAELR